jgi:cell division protein FtsQ
MPNPNERDELEEPKPSPYLRRSRRPEVRRRARWKRWVLLGGGILVIVGTAFAAAAYAFTTYVTGSPRFALRELEAANTGEHVPRAAVDRIFSLDVGRSVYEVPLETRRQQLMASPWVESAYVMRAWPNRLRVLTAERRPVAFVRLPPRSRNSDRPGGLSLIDRHGVLLPLPARGNFQFPVLTGVTESQPLPERQRRVGVLLAVMAELDSETPQRSGEISEADLSDPLDAAVTVTASGSAVLVHLGDRNFLDRYKLFLANLDQWRSEYGTVRTVDLRFEKQVIVQP